jgi:OmpA-OmpF porin, OOP family
MRRVLLLFVLASTSGCSLFVTQAAPFPPLEITAARPKRPDRVVLLPSNIVISDKVQFKVNSHELLEASYPLLDEVVAVMNQNPQIEEVQIEGHTDSTGKADLNKTLSQQRAESVMKYLVSKGIAQSRLTAKGFGSEKPIADNADAAGQETNRRVEFFIAKQGPIKTIVKGRP